MNVREAAALVVQEPWSNDVMMQALPVIRETPDEAIPVLEDAIKRVIQSQEAEMDESTAFGVASAAVLLGELKDMQAYDLILDLFANTEAPNQSVTLAGFIPAFVDVLMNVYPGNAARAKGIAMDTDLSQASRALAVYMLGHAAKEKDLALDEAADLLGDLIDFDQTPPTALTQAAVQSAVYAGLNDLALQYKDPYNKHFTQTLGTLEDLMEDPDIASHYRVSENLNYDDYIGLSLSISNLIQSLETGMTEDVEQDWGSLTPPEDLDPEMEALIEQMTKMSQEEMIAFMQANPAQALRIKRYINKHLPKKDLLANKKTSTRTTSLDEFKSKKKKKGGKKAAKAKAKGKKK